MKRVAAIVVLLLSLPAWAETRSDELKHVVNRNTGFAHLTRGVNMYTLIALRSCVGDAEIPVLTRML